jgi:hypothetical protein
MFRSFHRKYANKTRWLILAPGLLVVCLLALALARWCRQAAIQGRLVETIYRKHGFVAYEDELSPGHTNLTEKWRARTRRGKRELQRLYEHKTPSSARNVSQVAGFSSRQGDFTGRVFGQDFSSNLALVRGSYLDDSDLHGLGILTRLQSLRIEASSIGDDSLEEVGRLRKLKDLFISGSRVTDAGLVHLVHLEQLQRLTLFACDLLTDAGLASIADIKTLESLSLNGYSITSRGLEYLSNLPDLRSLELDWAGLSDDDLAPMEKFRRLERLSLKDTAVTDAGLRRLAAVKSLKTVSFSTRKVSWEAVEELQRIRPDLKIEGWPWR